jgi:hypothetical protein
MANLTADFNSYIQNQRAQTSYTIQGGRLAYIGGLAQINAAGTYVSPAASGTTTKIVGQFVKTVASGLTVDTEVVIREGDIFLDLGPAPAATAANIGDVVYACSDHEVNLDTASAKAGVLIAVRDSGCVVRVTQEANI